MNNPVESITIVEGTESAALGLVSRPKHVFSAVYPSREEADGVRLQLEERGIRAGQIRICHEAPPQLADDGSDDVLKDVLVDGGIGTLVGTGVGALGTLAIVASGVTLFVASPVVAPLAMLGWFASIGGVVGAPSAPTTRKGASPSWWRMRSRPATRCWWSAPMTTPIRISPGPSSRPPSAAGTARPPNPAEARAGVRPMAPRRHAAPTRYRSPAGGC